MSVNNGRISATAARREARTRAAIVLETALEGGYSPGEEYLRGLGIRIGFAGDFGQEPTLPEERAGWSTAEARIVDAIDDNFRQIIDHTLRSEWRLT